MNRNSDREEQEIIEEIEDDLEHPWNEDEYVGHRRTSAGFRPQRWHLVFSGAGIIILIIIIALFFTRGDNGSTEELNSITIRLDRIEKRLTQLEGMEQKISHVEGQFKGLQQSVSKLDKSGRSIKGRVDKITKNIDLLQKRIAAFSAAPGTEKEKPVSQAKRRYHQVRQGDTLYRIAKKYGISVDELRRLNNLTKSQEIYPGQKILVSRGSSQ